MIYLTVVGILAGIAFLAWLLYGNKEQPESRTLYSPSIDELREAKERQRQEEEKLRQYRMQQAIARAYRDPVQMEPRIMVMPTEIEETVIDDMGSSGMLYNAQIVQQNMQAGELYQTQGYSQAQENTQQNLQTTAQGFNTCTSTDSSGVETTGACYDSPTTDVSSDPDTGGGSYDSGSVSQ